MKRVGTLMGRPVFETEEVSDGKVFVLGPPVEPQRVTVRLHEGSVSVKTDGDATRWACCCCCGVTSRLSEWGDVEGWCELCGDWHGMRSCPRCEAVTLAPRIVIGEPRGILADGGWQEKGA